MGTTPRLQCSRGKICKNDIDGKADAVLCSEGLTQVNEVVLIRIVVGLSAPAVWFRYYYYKLT